MNASLRFWGIVVGILVVSSVVGFLVAPESNAGFADAAAVIAFATMAAVGIERVLEICWTLIDQARSLGAYWPMSVILPQIVAIESQTNTLLNPLFAQAKSALDTAKAGATGPALTQIEAHLSQLETTRTLMLARVEQATSLAPGSARIANVSAAATAMSDEMEAALNTVGTATATVQIELEKVRLAADNALGIIATFGDNPARRIGSLLVGAALGALVAGAVGINLFAAILDDGSNSLLQGRLGILVTGLIVGLGTGPTHELVKSLESSKKARQQLAVGTNGTAAAGTLSDASAGARASSRHVFIRATD